MQKWIEFRPSAFTDSLQCWRTSFHHWLVSISLKIFSCFYFQFFVSWHNFVVFDSIKLIRWLHHFIFLLNWLCETISMYLSKWVTNHCLETWLLLVCILVKLTIKLPMTDVHKLYDAIKGSNQKENQNSDSYNLLYLVRQSLATIILYIKPLLYCRSLEN